MGMLPFRLIRQRLRAAVFLGMVPLMILNGLPCGGCICSGGQFMLFCPGCRGPASRNVTAHAASTPVCCARKGCAQTRTDVEVSDNHRHSGQWIASAQPLGKAATRPCCQGHKSCCDRTNGHSGAAEGFKCSGCTPVLNMLAIPVVKASSIVLDHHQDLSPYAAVAALPSIVAAVHHRRCVEIDTEPPPNDLVVTFQRLII